jgi:uncharacterized protein
MEKSEENLVEFAKPAAEVDNRTVQLAHALNLRELQRYLARVGDRWPMQVVMLGGARVDDLRGAPAQRERGPEYVVVLVSYGFEGIPWLERVYQATALWDALEMGAQADIHCYTAPEFLRRRTSLRVIGDVVERGLLLFEDTAQPASVSSLRSDRG